MNLLLRAEADRHSFNSQARVSTEPMGDPEATVKLSEILRDPHIDSYCGSDYFAPRLTVSLIR